MEVGLENFFSLYFDTKKEKLPDIHHQTNSISDTYYQQGQTCA